MGVWVDNGFLCVLFLSLSLTCKCDKCSKLDELESDMIGHHLLSRCGQLPLFRGLASLCVGECSLTGFGPVFHRWGELRRFVDLMGLVPVTLRETWQGDREDGSIHPLLSLSPQHSPR